MCCESNLKKNRYLSWAFLTSMGVNTMAALNKKLTTMAALKY